MEEGPCFPLLPPTSFHWMDNVCKKKFEIIEVTLVFLLKTDSSHFI